MRSAKRSINGTIGSLTGLAYLILALTGADGIVWVIPVIVASIAYTLAAAMRRDVP